MAKGRKEDFNFRDLTTGFVLIVDQKLVEIAKRDFEYETTDNAVFAMGYIDHEVGISFEVLCLAEYGPNEEITLRRGNPSTSLKLRYDSINGIIILIEDKIMPAFQDKIDMIQNGYQVSEAIMMARNTTQFDDFRHPQFPDDVLLLFIQDDLPTEGIWCRINGEEDGRPTAFLLNEPYSDFRIHRGETITFEWTKPDDKVVGIARLPWIVEKETI